MRSKNKLGQQLRFLMERWHGVSRISWMIVQWRWEGGGGCCIPPKSDLCPAIKLLLGQYAKVAFRVYLPIQSVHSKKTSQQGFLRVNKQPLRTSYHSWWFRSYYQNMLTAVFVYFMFVDHIVLPNLCFWHLRANVNPLSITVAVFDRTVCSQESNRQGKNENTWLM